MRILILWASLDQPNLGVRALAVGTRALVERAFPGAEVEIQGAGPGDAPMSPYMRPHTLLKERVTGRRGLFEWLRSFDLVLDTRGGDSFADIYGVDRLNRMSLLPEVAYRLGVPVVLTPQTIGPFDTRRGTRLGRRSLRHAALVASRDPRSAAFAAALGRPVDVESTDVVFAVDHPEVERTRDVVLNVSGLLWGENPHVDAARYRAEVTQVAQQLMAQGREVTLLTHVVGGDSSPGDNDRYPLAGLREVLGDLEVVIPDGPEALGSVRQTVGSANLVIGSRMHACLNALSMGTPAIPLAYSRKFAPLLAQLGWEHVVDLREDEVVERTVCAAAEPHLLQDAADLRVRADVLVDRFADALVDLVGERR